MAFISPTNPFTNESLGDFKLESFEQQKLKVQKLKESQKAWKQETLDKRLSLVKEALNYFETNSDQIALDISEQMGRPYNYCKGELSGFFERANYLCTIAKDTLAPDIFTDMEGFDRSIEHCPLGTIFVISAWNYPLLITVNSVIPGLLAGNTILLKHSSLTPKIGEHFQKAFQNMGEYKNLFFSSIIDHETTGKVIEELPINHVIFTGSVNGGRQILSHTAKRFISPGLELGGKDAAYVHSDADIDYAAASIVDGGMFNSGQSCCGIERVYVHQAIYDDFIEKTQALIREYKLGDPRDEKTSMGPLASAKAAKYMEEQINDALSKGANLLEGGHIKKIGQGTFFEPTLLTEVSHEMEVMKEENFGPILPVMKVTAKDVVIDLINDSDYGLTCALFTNDKNIAKELAHSIDTGTVFMNRCDYLDPALPWTGVKNSGIGSSLSKYGFHSVTRRKSLHFKKQI